MMGCRMSRWPRQPPLFVPFPRDFKTLPRFWVPVGYPLSVDSLSARMCVYVQ